MILEEKFPYRQHDSSIIKTNCLKVDKEIFGVAVKKHSVRSLVKHLDHEDYTEGKAHPDLANNIYNMKMELLEYGPFFASISVYGNFITLSNNKVYQRIPGIPFVGGHAVEIRGYCDKGIDLEKQDVGYWVCKNTWGKQWGGVYGFKGYCMIKMGNNTCGIESRSGSAIPAVQKVAAKGKDSLDYIRYTDYISFRKDAKHRRRQHIK